VVAFKHISVEQTQQQLADNTATVVDIRDQQSFLMGHISGAIHLHNDNVEQFITNADKERPLIVCCYHGNSSQGAAGYLASQGFADVYSLDGGFELWRQRYPD
jgi:thiosulfate sulfurtransferase